MELADYKKQISELEHYTGLASRLAEVVEDEIKPHISSINGHLLLLLDASREIVSVKEDTLRRTAENEGRYIENIHELAEIAGIDFTEAKKIIDEDYKKTEEGREFLQRITGNVIESLDTLLDRKKKEIDEAKRYSNLIKKGVPEKTAEYMTLDIQHYIYDQIESFAKRYSIE
jgi:hypothetical protein